MANLGYIQLARRCNQKCVFCSNPDNGRILTLEQAKSHVDDFVARDYHGIILTGGEPTLFVELEELVRYANSKNMPPRMISNGQKTSRFEFLKSLKDAGLTHLHLSIHSYKHEVQDYLTQTPGSLKKQIRSLENAGKLGLTVDINCVINRYNANHLHKNVQWLVKEFPFIQHFVWNNMDPSMNADVDLDDVLHDMKDFEISLYKAMRFLDLNYRTFRAERIPLCYMAEYAHCSTETRKLVKNEERAIHFLDQKEFRREVVFEHYKGEACKVCKLNPVCAGLFKGDKYYKVKELSPVFIDPNVVRKDVLGDRFEDYIKKQKQK